ncbi:MAG: MarR family transcriptional regulator [Solirubrobacteraceae bacterium]
MQDSHDVDRAQLRPQRRRVERRCQPFAQRGGAHPYEHGEVSHATLQRRLGVDGATVTRLVKKLESQDAVNRRLDPTDNRFTPVSLTENGKQIAAEVHEGRRQFQRRLLAGVNREEQKTGRNRRP